MGWAAAEYGITRFRAGISPHNAASLNLIRKLGFAQAGAHDHKQRGKELIFHHESSPGQPKRAR